MNLAALNVQIEIANVAGRYVVSFFADHGSASIGRRGYQICDDKEALKQWIYQFIQDAKIPGGQQ